MNDPIPFYWEGVYHVFFQHNPGAQVWGNMHWGHCTSRDLIEWQVEPIALFPDQPYDKDGVFTGSIIEHQGLFYAFYTGIPQLDGLVQVQCLATSKDLYTWEKHALNPLFSEIPTGYGPCFRDPQVVQKGDEWWMILGSQTPRGGAALLYVSKNLFEWTYSGPLHEDSHMKFGEDYECPDLFELPSYNSFPSGEGWSSDSETDGVYQPHPSPPAPISPRKGEGEYSENSPPVEGWQAEPDGVVSKNKAVLLTSRGAVHWQTGHLEENNFISKQSGICDTSGENFYAAKTIEANGRRILFAWLREPNGAGWSGALALPRELFIKPDGALGQRPVKEALHLATQTQDGLLFQDQGITEFFPADGSAPTTSWA